MNRTRSLLTAAAILGLAFAGGRRAWPEGVTPGPARVTEGAKKIGRGVEETAKGFGEAIWGRMKYARRAIARFFASDK